MAQGLLTKGITLSYKPSTTFVELSDLQDIPDLGGEVEKVEVTTLNDGARKYINGIKDFGDLAFTFLYGNEVTDSFALMNALQGEYDADPTKAATEFQVELPDETTFTFSGFPSVILSGAGVNEALTFTLNIALNSDIVVA